IITNNNTSHETDERLVGGSLGALSGATLGYLLCGDPDFAPVARSSATPNQGDAPLKVELRAVGKDQDGEVVSFAWDLGDGNQAEGPEVVHTYPEPGDYVAQVTVTDDDGLTGTSQVQVRVSPVVSAAPPVVTPPPVAAPPPVEIELGAVLFDFDSAKLRSEATPVLSKAVQQLKGNPSVRIELAGHASLEGTPEYNQALSEQRARAVHDYLVEQGVSASNLRTAGYGESRPIADSATQEGRSQNRRVEFVVEE
ncbi:MAG: OmpA family protein, partial [Planctomycetota bacterium]